MMQTQQLRKEKPVSTIEKICVFLLAMTPILQHYVGLIVSASVTLLLVMLPYVAIKLLHTGKFKMRRLSLVLPLIVSFFYEVAAHGLNVMELGQAVVFSFYFLAIAAGCLSTKHFVKAITAISVAASLCILVQYFCYYILGFHLQMAPTSLFLERSEQWILLAQTGRVSVTGRPIRFYRPSAFFLEPSHMFIYMFAPLILNLLSHNPTKKQLRISMLLTIGMICSTSGMGIAAAAGVWLLFLGKNSKKNSRLDIRKFFRPRSALILLVLIVFAAGLFLFVPFFRNSILRIISSGDDYSNAVSGRISGGSYVLNKLKGVQWLFGASEDTTRLGVNLTGFTSEMYKYGIMGTLISYLFYFQGLLRMKNQYFWVAALTIVMSFFSMHSHGSFFMLGCAFTFTEGLRQEQLKKETISPLPQAATINR